MRLRNVSPRGDLRVTGHGHVPFGEEFQVLAEHVEGLIHQAYGDDRNFEPVDDEATKAVADAQAPAAEPEPVPAVISPTTDSGAAAALAKVSAAVAAVTPPAAPDTTTEESK